MARGQIGQRLRRLFGAVLIALLVRNTQAELTQEMFRQVPSSTPQRLQHKHPLPPPWLIARQRPKWEEEGSGRRAVGGG